MALTLNQVNKAQTKTKKPKTQTKAKVDDTHLYKPWKFKAEENMNPILDGELNDRLDFVDEETPEFSVKNRLEKLALELQKNSYALTKANKTLSWLRSIKVYPKFKIPLPEALQTIESKG